MRNLLLSALFMAPLIAGCKDDSGKSSPPPAAAAKPAPPPTKNFTDAKLLKFDLRIEPTKDAAPRYIVTWTASVPTGGWKLVKETVQVEDKHRELRMATVYATLIEPGPGDTVTQAQDTVSDSFDCGEQPIQGAQLLVRRRMNGVKSAFAELYGHVAHVGKQY